MLKKFFLYYLNKLNDIIDGMPNRSKEIFEI